MKNKKGLMLAMELRANIARERGRIERDFNGRAAELVGALDSGGTTLPAGTKGTITAVSVRAGVGGDPPTTDGITRDVRLQFEDGTHVDLHPDLIRVLGQAESTR